MEKETLCWSCDNRKCSWRQSFEPVKGWDAQKNIIKPDNTESYHVCACPEYHLWDRYLRWIIAANADEVLRGRPVLDDMVLGAMPTADAVMVKTRLTGAPITAMALCYNKAWWQMVKALKKSVNQYIEMRETMKTAEPDDDMKIYDPKKITLTPIKPTGAITEDEEGGENGISVFDTIAILMEIANVISDGEGGKNE